MDDSKNVENETELLSRLKKGDQEAANELIGRYFGRVLKAAELRIKTRNVGGSTPDDIAVSVFESLWRKSDEKRFAEEDLSTPDDLWRLLSKMVQFKANDHAKKNIAQKRGGGGVRGESVFSNSDESFVGMAGQADSEFTPDERLELKESCDVLLAKLEDGDLQKIAVMRLENFLVSDIASEFGKSERWVKRKLAIIRDIWEAAEPGFHD